MKIGFDLDGVVVPCQSVIWALMNNNIEAQRLAVAEAHPNPLFNPKMFMNGEDVGFIITARYVDLADITEQWVKKYYPDLQYINVDVKRWKTKKEWTDWYKIVAYAKAEAINNLGLDIYFEDMPITVKQLRKLCPNTKIILFGGRIEGV